MRAASQGALVYEDEPIWRIANPFKTDADIVTAPFTDLLVGILENPVVYPGNPLCNFIELDEATQQVVEKRREHDD